MAFDPVTAAMDTYALATTTEPMSYPGDAEDNLMVSVASASPSGARKFTPAFGKARLHSAASKQDKQGRLLSLRTETQRALFELEDAHRRWSLYQDRLLPEAQGIYEGLAAAYAADMSGTDLLDVLDSVQTLLDMGLEEARALRDGHLASAALERITARGWPGKAADTPAK